MASVAPPPVRYSASEPDYDPEVAARIRIFVDGVEQTHVISYDCEARMLMRYVLNVDGTIRITEGNDYADTEVIIAAITVAWKD